VPDPLGFATTVNVSGEISAARETLTLHGLMPIAATRWLGRGSNSWSQATRGVIFGLPIPVCSCGVVPVYRTLVQRGAPVAAALGLLIAAPELGLDSVFLSARLLGTEFTVVRCIAAAVLAIVAAVLVIRGFRKEESAELPPTGEPEAEWGVRFRQGLKTGFGDLVDHTGPWILLGLALAACTYPILSTQWLTQVSPTAQVPLFALLGIPVYVCASGATPLVAVLLAGGVSPGAALAFLLTGPATNVTTFGVLSALHSTRFALRFGAAVALLAVILGYAVDAIGIQVDPRVEPHGDVSIAAWVALAALCGVFALSLLRQGPRAFVGQVLIQSDPADDHDHAHCDH
ncbi:MAG: permease, partial [Planctomycetota bacterium]